MFCHDLRIDPPQNWIKGIQGPLLISGPCSAESEDQVMMTALALSRIPSCRVLRAGIWKPRTRPSGFQGVGESGLLWLKRASEKTGMLAAVEVATPGHIELAMKHGIDILWLGARTVVNPFSVQDLSEALRGTTIPVMVKNPPHPDIQLWMGAIERLFAAGINKLIAVHRGFHHFGWSPYRNDPMWEVPIELKRLCPDLPVICDPSHIAGNRLLIKDICQKSLDLAMDGLMIETHYRPDEALTDHEQQITPEQLQEIMGSLVIREKEEGSVVNDNLLQLRTEIDLIDNELISILSKRMHIAEEIGKYKHDHGITIFQLRRWSAIIEDRLKKGVEKGLDREFLLKVLQLMHKESIRIQMQFLEKNRDEDLH